MAGDSDGLISLGLQVGTKVALSWWHGGKENGEKTHWNV